MRLYVHRCCMVIPTASTQILGPKLRLLRLRSRLFRFKGLEKSHGQKSLIFVGCFLPDLQILTAASVNLNRPDVLQTLQRDISKCPVANLGPNICWSAWPLSTESKVDEALYRCDAMQWCEIFSLSNSEIMHLFQHLETWWLFNFSAPFRCSSDWHL